MPLLKDGTITDDPWLTVADGDPIPADRPAIVSFDHWKEQRAHLIGRNQQIGLSLEPNAPIEEIAEDIERFSVITLAFPAFTDGRSYSLARLLREKYGYRGELRAVGHVLRDQFAFLCRCGFDALEIADSVSPQSWQTAVSEMPFGYQPANDSGAATVFQLRRRKRDAETKAARLSDRYGDRTGHELVRAMLTEEFAGRIAVVSSFGAEAAVLLGLVAQTDPATPVIFLETGKHFPETLAYRDQLIAHFGLTDVRSVHPDRTALSDEDPDGELWRKNPDRCCHLRKVLPLERALNGFDAWLTGRKRYQGGARSELPTFEAVDGRVKINPLADWSHAAVDTWLSDHDVPRHPLAELGFLSIGCAPCTEATSSSSNLREGRWVGTDKTECGIHQAKWAG